MTQRFQAQMAVPCLYLIASRGGLDERAYLDRVAAIVDAGATMVQMREKASSATDMRRLGSALAALARQRGALFIVNDDPALAVELGADGVHVGRTDVDPLVARQIVGPQRLVGVSTHDEEQVRLAATQPIDLIGIGPVFPTSTKEAGPPLGVATAAALARLAGGLPSFAIGGIDAAAAGRLAESGVRRVAVSQALLGAPDPGIAAARILRAMA